ncbi:MAG: MGMT family protein [Verrucomicrobiota bacterium]
MEYSFGPLLLSLELTDEGTLNAVHLPKDPPTDLDQKHLQAALQFLAKHSVAPAKSQGESAFRVALTQIPSGQTRTYGQLAKLLATSPRAVGRWCASNRLLLRIPCHRVVATSGLSGFRAGVEWKRLLLRLEQ